MYDGLEDPNYEGEGEKFDKARERLDKAHEHIDEAEERLDENVSEEESATPDDGR